MRCVCVGDKRNGFIVENDKNVGVFSVNMQGNTRMGSGRIADLSTGKWTGFGHYSQTGKSSCAISQTHTGETIVNAAKGKRLNLRTDNKDVARVEGTRFDVLNTGQDAYDTHFNHAGNNYISCDWEGNTYFRAGKSNARAHYNKHGFYAGGYNVENELRQLKKDVADLKGEMRHRLDLRRPILIKNDAARKYCGSNGKPHTRRTDTHAHHHLEHD